MSSTFEDYVNLITKKRTVGNEIHTIYGRSKCGQKFAVIVTKTVWYATRLIVDEDHRDLWKNHKGLMNQLWSGKDWILKNQHLHYETATLEALKWASLLEDGNYDELLILANEVVIKPRIITLPKDWANNLDKYLKPGDIIQSNFYVLASHEGIYIGNNEVIHVSSNGTPTKSKVQIGKIIPHFVTKPTDNIRIKIFRLRYKSAMEIILAARKYAHQSFRDGEYHLLKKNCQHFASLCVLGYEECEDIHRVARLGNAATTTMKIGTALKAVDIKIK